MRNNISRYNHILELSKKLKSKFLFNHEIYKSTWFKAGGNADVFCLVYDENDLEIILNNIGDIPYYVIGSGSNLLVRDGGYQGIIIKLGKLFNNLSFKENNILVGASILDKNLAKFAYINSIKNFEFFSGIPGSIGGAIKMNAGCYGFETKNLLKSINILSKKGVKKSLKKNDLNLSYRSSNLKDQEIITSALFKIAYADKEEIKSNIENIDYKRKYTQPIKFKTSGSTFKNPKGLFAAKLIEDSDCKGLCVGDAVVSTKHANFFVNLNQARASDIEDLIKIVKERVYTKFEVKLDLEIKIIGEKSE